MNVWFAIMACRVTIKTKESFLPKQPLVRVSLPADGIRAGIHYAWQRSDDDSRADSDIARQTRSLDTREHSGQAPTATAAGRPITRRESQRAIKRR